MRPSSFPSPPLLARTLLPLHLLHYEADVGSVIVCGGRRPRPLGYRRGHLYNMSTRCQMIIHAPKSAKSTLVAATCNAWSESGTSILALLTLGADAMTVKLVAEVRACPHIFPTAHIYDIIAHCCRSLQKSASFGNHDCDLHASIL